MTQTFEDIPSGDTLKDSRQKILDRTEAAASSFAGISFPATTWAGQPFLNTTTNILYMRTMDNSAWKQVADLNSTNVSKLVADSTYAMASHTHTGGEITGSVGNATLAATATNALKLGTHDAAVFPRLNSKNIFSEDLVVADNKKTSFGTDEDFEITYDTNAMYLRGKLPMKGQEIRFQAYDTGEVNRPMIYMNPGSSVMLYYKGALKFSTSNDGATVNGSLTTNEGKMGTNGVGTKTVSTSPPSGTGHVAGDTWIQY